MDSMEDEKLFQMVHDFFESESPPPIFSSSSSESPPPNHHTKYLILQEILRRGTDAETEILESVFKHMTNKMDTKKTVSLKKWLVTRLKGDGYNASLCQTSWVTTLTCPGGDYQYIDIIMKDENGNSLRLILDIDFKSQFEVARPTPVYKELSDKLPSIFVGDEHKLRKIIPVLCSAAKQSLRDRGLHIPPWRTSTYMQSKWLCVCHKLPITPSREDGREKRETKVGTFCSSEFSEWTPPIVKPERRNFGSGSGLSNQFSNMRAKCC